MDKLPIILLLLSIVMVFILFSQKKLNWKQVFTWKFILAFIIVFPITPILLFLSALFGWHLTNKHMPNKEHSHAAPQFEKN